MKRHFSLQVSLSTAFIGVVLLSCAVLGANTFVSVRRFVRDGIRERLRDAVQLAALVIDPDAHAKIRTAADAAGPEYRAIAAKLRQVRDRTRGVRFVYTLRRDEKGKFRFVVDAEEDGKDKSAVGDVYENPTAAMRDAFEGAPHTVVEDGFTTDKWGTYLSSYAPLVGAGGLREAVVGMDISADEVLAYERQYLLLIVLGALAVSIGGVGLGFVLSGTISRPLLQLTQDLAQVRNLDLDSHAPVHSTIREVVQMKEAVDHMKSGLRSFRKYVPSDLVSELIRMGHEAALGAERREMTFFFSDIEGFTTISEDLPPELLSARLADYLRGMTRTLLEHRATVDKFIGDAVMAFWGAPGPADDHAVQACLAALACQRFIATLASRWPEGPRTSFFTRIGVHSGEALVGNFGFEERLSYTAIGDTVNTASRLEGLNKLYGSAILISDVTLARVGGRFVTRRLEKVVVKGKTHGMAVHELIGERSSMDPNRLAAVDRFNAAMDLYLARRFPEAGEVFRDLAASDPDDQPARHMEARCRELAAAPPPDGWDGVVHMRSK